MTFQNDIIGSSPARHASMRPSVLLFGATSILGFNLAQLFPKPFYRLSHPGIAAELSDNGRCSSWRIPIGLKRSSLGTNPKFSFTAKRFATYRSTRRLLPGLARSTSSMFVSYLRVLPEKAKLVYVSSDHVFGGNGVYDEKSTPCPISVHGRTRVDAEELTLTRSGSLATTERCQRSARSVKASIFDSFARCAVYNLDILISLLSAAIPARL